MISLKKVCRELFKSNQINENYFRDFESVKEYLDEICSLATRKNTLTSIMVCLKSNSNTPEYLVKLYGDYHADLIKKQKDSYKDQDRSVKETENWITLNDISQKIDYLNKSLHVIDHMQQHLVLNLYTKLPPMRNDWANMIVISSEDDDAHMKNCIAKKLLDSSCNYINIKTNKVYMCNYKTMKTYGMKCLDLDESICSLIKNFVNAKKKNGYEGNKLLINVSNGSPMTKNGLTKYLNKIFKPKKVSTTLLRKVYLSERYPVLHTTRDMERDAEFMMHNVSTQQGVYRKSF